MVSLITYFKENEIEYTVTSSSGNPYYAFEKDKRFDIGTSSNGLYWQISFSRPVTIDSYIISAPAGWGSYSETWSVSYSLDNQIFTHFPAYGMYDLRKNKDKFALPKPAYCLHFRITGIRDNGNSQDLQFNSFDCFGTIGAVQNKQKKLCAVSFAMFRQSILPKIIMLLYPSFLPT